MLGKSFQMLLFVVNQTPQLLAKHSGNSVQLLNLKGLPELHLSHLSYAS